MSAQVSQREGLISGEVRGTSGEVRGTSGEVRGTSGEVEGKSGKLLGNLWIAVRFHSKRTFGEVGRGTSKELPGKSGTFQKLRGA